MEGRKLLQSIRLDGILSYAPGTPEFPLEPLNVLIGPNASGKSNLIEALSILHATQRDVQTPLREGGGVQHWLWKGAGGSEMATVEVTIPHFSMPVGIRYRLSFSEILGQFVLREETVESEQPLGEYQPQLYIYYRNLQGSPAIIDTITKKGDTSKRELQWDDVIQDQSILSQRRDPQSHPELTYLAFLFSLLAFYREFPTGRQAPARLPQQGDLQQDRLLEDASNLGVLLNILQNHPETKRALLKQMKEFYAAVEDVFTTVIGGTVQINFHEKGLHAAVPATRLSDGSLRYLCLLAILCHSASPPIICIEEPEVGLHPDMLPGLAKLLVEASKRSQIFVTTHSEVLVDALTDTPEAIVVCEKVDGATQLRRLNADELKPWLEKYRLGELWTSGHIGGNRW